MTVHRHNHRNSNSKRPAKGSYGVAVETSALACRVYSSVRTTLLERTFQIVYVNYRSRNFLKGSLQSVAEHAGDVPRIEITVVDNSCDAEEATAIAAMLPTGAQLIRTDDNLGFAQACNLGAGVSRAKHILFLNPDTIVLPDTLPRLWKALEELDGEALIGPRHFADLECNYAHAPYRGVQLFDEARDQVFARGWDRRRPLRYLRQRARLARTPGPVAVRSISGGCLAVGRSTFEALGGWDENYWMYGEDLELCVRARRHGIPVLLFPDVGLVHFMERSARHLPTRMVESQTQGRRRFKQDRHGAFTRSLDRWLTGALRRLPQRSDPWREATQWDGGPLQAPPNCDRWAIELARSPLFDNCLTAFPQERQVQLPVDLLDRLQPGTYFVRVAGERDPGRWHQTRIHSLTRDHAAAVAS